MDIVFKIALQYFVAYIFGICFGINKKVAMTMLIMLMVGYIAAMFVYSGSFATWGESYWNILWRLPVTWLGFYFGEMTWIQIFKK